uniref:Chemosensory protein 11 n=1 Tax=Yemma signatus TaxID=300820 RepID=A0A3G2GRR6_9HEMI|nr:chemosensory protein 11 [Yemma signatus]
MNAILALLVLGLAGLVAAQGQGGPQYTTRFDNVNLDDILSNDRLYRKYYDCLMSRGKCTPDGKELKERLPEAMRTRCEKCTPRQKAGAEKVVRFLLKKKPADYEALERLYDPTQAYRKFLLSKKQ